MRTSRGVDRAAIFDRYEGRERDRREQHVRRGRLNERETERACRCADA
ncbi:MAG: hypothetical protein MZV70_69630 [Desulfobacterales bacterium]|nr:hypothetical protein [Desulfobacterales bacterium]